MIRLHPPADHGVSYRSPPAHSLRLSRGIFTFLKGKIPHWNTTMISGYCMYTFHLHVH